MNRLEAFLNFAKNAPTAFHAVEQLKNMLNAAGFRALSESEPWQLKAGTGAMCCATIPP